MVAAQKAARDKAHAEKQAQRPSGRLSGPSAPPAHTSATGDPKVARPRPKEGHPSDSSVSPDPSPEALGRTVAALSRKRTEILKLETQAKDGKELDPNQRAKVARKVDVEVELEAARARLAALQVQYADL